MRPLARFFQAGRSRGFAAGDVSCNALWRTCVFTATLVASIALAGPAAHASVTLNSFAARPSTSQAGGHPDFVVAASFSSRQSSPGPCACNDAKDVDVHLPAGLIGNPHATPQCDIAHFASDRCPVDSQLGFIEVGLASEPSHDGSYNPVEEKFLSDFVSPVFNLIPPPAQPALLGFKAGFLNTPTFEDVSARTATDYGLDVDVSSIFHGVPVVAFKQDTWGVPADPLHNSLRFEPGEAAQIEFGGELRPFVCDANDHFSTDDPATMIERCPFNTIGHNIHTMGLSGPIPSNSPETPFLQNPTTCGLSSLETSVDVLSYDGGTTRADASWPATTDCAQLTFNPSQSIAPTTEAADSPSGAEFRLTVPQFESPSVPSPSELRAAEVTLPQGFSLAPNVTNGKTTCSEAEARMGAYASTEEGHCPEDSKIGTISVETPVLPGPLPGAVYLGEPKSGNRFRTFLVFDGFGVHVKLPGTVTPDPATGQIHIDFQNLPQAPFETFNMHVFGSERGPLDTPTQCGDYEVSSVFTPWDEALPSETSRQFFNVDSGPAGSPCPNGARPFTPGFTAGVTDSTAGSHTSFSLNLTREDGEQNLAALNLSTPPGFSATFKGVSYCPQAAIDAAALEIHSGLAEQAAPSCPASSLLGEFTTGSGPGTHPLYLPGKVYLAGPYKGAPLSLVFITPAVSAGYDLGNVVIRAALRVNPETAQATAVSNPLPQIFQGIPLRLRQIMVNLNRPGFVLNPTNCDPFSIGAQVFGNEGATANLSSHFQVANCASLAYKPKLSLKLSGGLSRLGHPAIHSVLTAKPGEANTASVSVALPKGEILDNAHIRSPCTRVELNAETCPPGSALGHAVADTPLLDQPLEGPVYLTTGFGHQLPDLVADLRGQIHIQLDGKVDTVNGGSLRTTFQTVPDAPVSTFTLDLAGGSKGLIQNSESLCGPPKRAVVTMAAQNGKTADQNPLLQVSCGKNAKKHKRHGKARANAHRRAGR